LKIKERGKAAISVENHRCRQDIDDLTFPEVDPQ